MPHTEPRDYYVSLQRGSRTALLAGPFKTHTEAIAMVEPATKLANDLDLWSWFDAYGTCSLPRYPWNPRDKLNSQLGVLNDAN